MMIFYSNSSLTFVFVVKPHVPTSIDHKINSHCYILALHYIILGEAHKENTHFLHLQKHTHNSLAPQTVSIFLSRFKQWFPGHMQFVFSFIFLYFFHWQVAKWHFWDNVPWVPPRRCWGLTAARLRRCQAEIILSVRPRNEPGIWPWSQRPGESERERDHKRKMGCCLVDKMTWSV